VWGVLDKALEYNEKAYKIDVELFAEHSITSTVSRLIKEAVALKLIKPLDPTTAPRYMRYIPNWA